MSERILSVAPMIGWTDRHYRYLMRHITRETELFMEMVMDKALLHNIDNLTDFIGHDDIEHPLALQLGGNDPNLLADSVSLVEGYCSSFSQINLNCGCPSNKAKKAGFGAELMLEPDLVREIVHSMCRRASNTEITVKCRIGTCKRNTWPDLLEFVEACKAGGARTIIVHSRICIMRGLSPAQNRNIPPLRYDVVHSLVEQYPELRFVLNGGVQSFVEADAHMGRKSHQGAIAAYDQLPAGKLPWPLPEVYRSTPVWAAASKTTDVPFSKPLLAPLPSADQHGKSSRNGTTQAVSRQEIEDLPTEPLPVLSSALEIGSTHSDSVYDKHCYECWPPVSGVMIGREAYNHPWSMATADSHFFGRRDPCLTRREVLQHYLDYTESFYQHRNAPEGGYEGRGFAAIPTLCKPLHNFFHGAPLNRSYKQQFDLLIKQNAAERTQRHQHQHQHQHQDTTPTLSGSKSGGSDGGSGDGRSGSLPTSAVCNGSEFVTTYSAEDMYTQDSPGIGHLVWKAIKNNIPDDFLDSPVGSHPLEPFC